MKSLIIAASLLLSVSSFAESSLVGDWCQLVEGQVRGVYVRPTDFTTVMSIDSEGSIMKMTVGNSHAGEHYPLIRGHISIGAGNVIMELDNKAVYVYDYKITRNIMGKKKLKIDYNDRPTERYKECKVTWRKK
ncbi:MAG: hypothetical protein ACRBBP_09895 [Bdellovibrionales bacterium]